MKQASPPSAQMTAATGQAGTPSQNPVLRKIGLSGKDRVVIFHADDIGMSQASLQAYVELAAAGLHLAASTMAPCAWFPATAIFCRQNPEGLDMGVHLTLNSEWEGFRWGPVSHLGAATGLTDAAGYFHNRTEAVHRLAEPAALRRELQAQIERVLAAGVDATHLDSHMFAIFHPRLLPLYFALARQFRLPAFMLRANAAAMKQYGIEDEAATLMASDIRQAEEDGIPLFDHVFVMPLEAVPNRLEHARQVLANLPAGLTYFIIHPSTDTAELRAMAHDWPARVGDYRLFLSDDWRQAVQEAGVHVIAYHQLRSLMR